MLRRSPDSKTCARGRMCPWAKSGGSSDADADEALRVASAEGFRSRGDKVNVSQSRFSVRLAGTGLRSVVDLRKIHANYGDPSVKEALPVGIFGEDRVAAIFDSSRDMDRVGSPRLPRTEHGGGFQNRVSHAHDLERRALEQAIVVAEQFEITVAEGLAANFEAREAGRHQCHGWAEPRMAKPLQGGVLEDRLAFERVDDGIGVYVETHYRQELRSSSIWRSMSSFVRAPAGRLSMNAIRSPSALLSFESERYARTSTRSMFPGKGASRRISPSSMWAGIVMDSVMALPVDEDPTLTAFCPTKRRRTGHESRRTAESVRSVPSPSAPERALTLGGMATAVDSDVANEDWTYAYEPDMNWLTSSTNGLSTNNQTWTYDSLGRFTSNSRVASTFTYPSTGNPRVHAPTQISGGTLGTVNFSYDSNGNMTSGNGRAMTWNPDNLITQVVANSVTTNYEYGPEGDRIKKTSGGLVTYYPFGDAYEAIPSQGKYTIYFDLGFGIVAKKIGPSLTYWLHGDRLGSMNAKTGAAGDYANCVPTFQ